MESLGKVTSLFLSEKHIFVVVSVVEYSFVEPFTENGLMIN